MLGKLEPLYVNFIDSKKAFNSLQELPLEDLTVLWHTSQIITIMCSPHWRKYEQLVQNKNRCEAGMNVYCHRSSLA